MRPSFTRLTLLLGLITFCQPAFTATEPVHKEEPIPIEIVLKKIKSLKVKDIQRITGRKLTLKEKIGFGLLKHTLKKKPKENSKKGETALVFGIVALGTLILGFFVPYVILVSLVSSILAIVIGSVAKKQDPADRKAHAGKLLGWLTLGLIGLLIIAVAIALSGFEWGWG